MKITKLILAALCVAISACGHKIHEGEIIDKYYEPARTYTYTTMIMSGKIMIPQTHTGYDDEDFVLVVRGMNGKEVITEEFYIDEENWECVNIGNTFNDSVPCSREDDGTK